MRRRGKRFKKKSNSHKFAIIICLAIIIGALCFIFKDNLINIKDNLINIFNKNDITATDNDKKTVDGVEIVPNDNKESMEISEEEAKDIAIRQFANLGEGANPNKLNVIRLQRNGEEFFYVASPKNTVEIRISDGKITKINSVIVEE